MDVLIVEDEIRLACFLEQVLTGHAYRAHVAPTGSAANEAIAQNRFDIVILDLGLPDSDGLDLVRGWRDAGFAEPVLILSARGKREDRIAGLDLGADDYLPKPFGIDELLSRMRALIRRQGTRRQTLHEHGGIKVDLLTQCVRIDEERVELTAREFALITIFIQNPGRILSRHLIAEKIWNSHFDTDANLLDVYMSRLRMKFGAVTDRPVFKTVRGIGYQLL